MLTKEQYQAWEEEKRQKEAAEAETRLQIFQQEANAEALKQEPQVEAPEGEADPEQPDKETPAEAKESSEKIELDRGAVTEFGEAMREGIDPLNIADKAVQAFADLVPEETGAMYQAAQGLSDLVPSRDDVNEQIADVPVLGQLGAASEGIMSAPTLPVAIAGRVANQDISFYDTPAVYKDTWAGDAVFKISQAIAAAYMTRGVVPGGGSAGLVGNALGEGAIESVPIRAAEDIPFWGPELAQGMGEIANGLGFEGGAFTRDLIEGRSPGAQATNAVFGFLQNSLMIAGSDAIFRKIFKNAKGKSAEPEAPQNVKDTARVTKQSEKAVRDKLDNQTEPIPNPRAEPSDVKDIDTSVGVTQPREGSRVSFEAALAVALKRHSYYDETIPAADNNYFLNLKTITDDAGYKQILNDITRPLRRLRDFPQDLGRVMNNLAPQMDSIKELMGLDRYDDVAKLLVDEVLSIVERLKGLSL